MTLFLGSLPYLATWLLPFAGAVTILEPPALQEHVRELAQRAHDFFVLHLRRSDIGLSRGAATFVESSDNALLHTNSQSRKWKSAP
jgi:hypothetical protein